VANTEIENRTSFAGHQAVFEAIERRDPEAAGQAMRAHLENARSKFNSGSGRLDWPADAAALWRKAKSPPFKAGGLPSIIQRDPVADNQDDRISASAAGCAQGAGFDGFEATSDPSLPALARLGFS